MEDYSFRISAIEIVLDSFADFRKKSEEERLDFLESKFPNNKYLKTYFTYSLKESKREKEQLQEEKLKLLPSTTGNEIFIYGMIGLTEGR